MLRIALIGCGHHGRLAVTPAIIQHSQRTKLIAVSDLHRANMADAASLGLGTYVDFREMFAKENLDAVYVATLVETHTEIVQEALRAGLHVVCEKPMASTAKECQQMVDAAREANRYLVVNFETRYHPHHRQIRRWIEEGHLGRIEAIHLQQFWDGHKNFGEKAGRRANLIERSGGLDCGIHKVDLARYFCGGGEWTLIHAAGAWFDEKVTNPPHIAIVARLDQGPLVTIHASLAYAASIAPRPMQDVMTIVGTEGVASIAIDAESPEAFHREPSEVHLYSRHKVEHCSAQHPPHQVPIGQLLDDLAGLIEDGVSSSELPMGEAGVQAQVLTEEANRQAILEKFQLTARKRDASGDLKDCGR